MKKFRPFWSYRIENTNRWLEQLALQGQHLKKVNTVLRLFTFEEKPVQVKHYAIQYKENGIPTSLQNDGWTKVDKSISWLFLENGKESIKSYPVNDSLHRRLRLHLYICYFFLFFFLPMQFGMFFLLSGGAEFAVLPLVIYGLLVILTIFLFIQHRKSESQFVKKPNGSLNGRTAIKKIRPGWMYLPYQTKIWLNKMADQGYELHHVGATIFTFVEKRSECVAYEISFEKSVSKEYYMLHQDMGWQLKTIDGSGWFNYSIWMMPHHKMEEIPAFTYDPIEKVKSVRKTFTANFLLGGFITIVVGQSAYRSISNWDWIYGTSHYAWMLRVLSILVFGLWLILFLKIIIGFFKEMKQLKMN